MTEQKSAHHQTQADPPDGELIGLRTYSYVGVFQPKKRARLIIGAVTLALLPNGILTQR